MTTDAPNKVRGETAVELGGRTFVLKPEHGRAVRLDDALPLGILGTLIQLTEERTIKARTLATVVHHLTSGSPGVDALVEMVLATGVTRVAGQVVFALSAVAAGSHSPGEGEPPSAAATA